MPKIFIHRKTTFPNILDAPLEPKKSIYFKNTKRARETANTLGIKIPKGEKVNELPEIIKTRIKKQMRKVDIVTLTATASIIGTVLFAFSIV